MEDELATSISKGINLDENEILERKQIYGNNKKEPYEVKCKIHFLFYFLNNFNIFSFFIIFFFFLLLKKKKYYKFKQKIVSVFLSILIVLFFFQQKLYIFFHIFFY